jgi:two-component system chemotaxis sensor kinase CheA
MTAEENPFAELMAEYVAECLPLAEEVLDRTLMLERAWAGGEQPDEALRPLRGQLHTLKGNSAMMGLGPLQALAHLLEDLTALLDADPSCRTVGARLLVRGAGLLTDLIRGATSGPIPDLAVQDFVEEGRAFLDGEGGAREIPHSDQREEDRRRGERRTRGSPGEVGGDGSVTTIRIESSRLDALLESFGEAMIAQSGIRDAARRLARGGRPTPDVALLEQSILSLDRTLKRLGGALMASRLLPLSTIFGRFTRQVRDLALAESKRVRLEVAGGETRLDKTIIDRLGEPLVHLMTNAVIHGIESAAEREALGKPAEAVITLRAVQRSDWVLLTLADDGRGLDPERILCKARALGLAPAAESPTRAEIFGLAFLPGLSTAERVSALSGRGVGLDVVANSIRMLGGQVAVASEPGRGTTFTLRLPLTVAVLRSLLVEVGGERYALPLADVTETVRTGTQVIHQIARQGVMSWRGEVIPVLDGGVALGNAAGGARRYCVVLRSATRHRGLLVDALLGHHEVVVKALDPALGRPPAISGATILGDGRVACILDTARLGESVPEHSPDAVGAA